MNAMQPLPCVADVMTPNVIVLREEDSLEEVEDALQRWSFRHLPVVDGRRLVGLVSQRDMLRLVGTPVSERAATYDARRRGGTFVADIMVRDVHTARAEMSLADAARTLVKHRLGCLPVVDAAGTLIGIVTADDLLRVLAALIEPSAQAPAAAP